MGCDIHAMIEAKFRYRHNLDDEGHWMSCGRVKIDRDYDLFAKLANVRNYGKWPFISEPRSLVTRSTSMKTGIMFAQRTLRP